MACMILRFPCRILEGNPITRRLQFAFLLQKNPCQGGIYGSMTVNLSLPKPMLIYLPIAEISVNAIWLVLAGASVGMLSGLFGVGGGFLLTPLLIFMGIPPAIAVSTQAPQIVASSLSAVLTHWKRRTVDFRMGLVLLSGGIMGSALGVQLFRWLRQWGQIESFVSIAFVVLLGSIGSLMLVESLRALRIQRAGTIKPRRRHGWIHKLPFKMRFRESHLYISVIPPLLIGFGIGILSAVLGVGGGFIMLPAMIYLLGMPTNVVIGTSQFQIMFLAMATTLMHAVQNRTVDAALALLLILGGVIGAQFGTAIGARLRGEQLRLLLALVVLMVGCKLALDLVLTPAELFSLDQAGLG